MGAFHAYDIRGIYNKDFDKDQVYKIGYFLPQLLHTKRIAVGRDCRLSSPEIHQWLLSGLVDAGACVYDLGLATTPLVYYATAKHHFDASVQITASHNSKEYNGLKVSRTGAMPVGYDNGLGTLENWINTREVQVSQMKGQVVDLDLHQEYLDFMLSHKPNIDSLNIGFDLSNGMASLFASAIFGSKPHYINQEMDGRFPNHEPNPLIPANTVQICNLVKEKACDIGVIYDGDADRVMFIDNLGRFISPDLIIALLGHHFLEGKSGKDVAVLQDIRSSKAVGEYLKPMGAVMHTWKVGRAFAAPKLCEIDGLFGGELAGHYYFKDFFYSDSGILASLFVLEVVAKFKAQGRSLASLIDGIRKYENSGEMNFTIEKKKEAMDAVRDYFLSRETPTASYDFDGYRVEFPNWWFNIRPSNTEPYLRFIAEASSSELLQEKIRAVRLILNA